MRVQFTLPLSFNWTRLKGGLNGAFERVDYRALPDSGGQGTAWSIHVLGTPVYATFTWLGPYRAELSGVGLESLDPVLTALGAKSVPPLSVAQRGEDAFEFIAAAAWESEGCLLFPLQPQYLGGKPREVRFAIDEQLLSYPPLLPLRRLLSPLLEEEGEAEDKEDPDRDAPALTLQLETQALLDATALSVGAVPGEDVEDFMASEAQACLVALTSWLERRLRSGDKLCAEGYEESSLGAPR